MHIPCSALRQVAVVHRLHKQGLRVVVERPVHRTEFPEYDAFDPEQDGRDCCWCLAECNLSYLYLSRLALSMSSMQGDNLDLYHHENPPRQ